MLADPNFNIQLNVSQLDVAVNNIVTEGYSLAEPSLAANGENIPIQGLLGVIRGILSSKVFTNNFRFLPFS